MTTPISSFGAPLQSKSRGGVTLFNLVLYHVSCLKVQPQLLFTWGLLGLSGVHAHWEMCLAMSHCHYERPKQRASLLGTGVDI